MVYTRNFIILLSLIFSDRSTTPPYRNHEVAVLPYLASTLDIVTTGLKFSSINPYYFNYFIVSVCFRRYLIATVGATSQGVKEPEKIRPCSIHLWLYAKISHCQCMFLNNFLLCLELKYVHSHWNSIHHIKIARREGTSNVSYLLWSPPESHCYNTNHGFK